MAVWMVEMLVALTVDEWALLKGRWRAEPRASTMVGDLDEQMVS